MSHDRSSPSPMVAVDCAHELADAGERICVAALETIMSAVEAEPVRFGEAADTVKVVAESVSEMASDLFPEADRVSTLRPAEPISA